MDIHYLKKFRHIADMNIAIFPAKPKDRTVRGVIMAITHPDFKNGAYFTLRGYGWDWRGFFRDFDIREGEDLTRIMKEAKRSLIHDLIVHERCKREYKRLKFSNPFHEIRSQESSDSSHH